MISVDDEILFSTQIVCSRPCVNEIIEEWKKNESETGARHCMEAFLTCVVVHELRLKGVQARIDKLGVGGGKRCDFRIDPYYKVEIEKSLRGIIENLVKPIKHHPNCNPFLLISLTEIDETALEKSIEDRYESIPWEFSSQTLRHGVAVLAKKMNQLPYSTGLK